MKQKKYIQLSSDQNSFTINKKAYIDFFFENDLHTKIAHIRGAMDRSNKKADKTIQTLILETPFSETFIEEVFGSYGLLGGLLKDANVSMRVLGPDVPTISLATIHGEATLLLEIKKMWASNPIQKNGFDIVIEKENENTFSANSSQSGTTENPINKAPSFFTATKIYTTMPQLDLAVNVAKRQVDGIGLLDMGNVIQAFGIHPKEIIRSGKKKDYINKFISYISPAIYAFSPRPVLCKLSSLDTSLYKRLEGGNAFEQTEPNPTLGVRGSMRHMNDPELLSLELEVIRSIREIEECKNIWLLLPFVRTVEELREMKKYITDAGLYRSPNFKIWMTVEVPSNVILLEKFIEEGIDGVSIDLDGLTVLMLGIHTGDTPRQQEYTYENSAVQWAVEHTIAVTHLHHLPSCVYTSIPPSSQLLTQLIRWGITSITVDPNEIEATRAAVAEIEKELIKF